MGGDGGEAGGSPAAAAAAADDPASAILLLYSSLADVQAVLEADSADADALKVREGEAMRERSDGARGREKKKTSSISRPPVPFSSAPTSKPRPPRQSPSLRHRATTATTAVPPLIPPPGQPTPSTRPRPLPPWQPPLVRPTSRPPWPPAGAASISPTRPPCGP